MAAFASWPLLASPSSSLSDVSVALELLPDSDCDSGDGFVFARLTCFAGLDLIDGQCFERVEAARARQRFVTHLPAVTPA